MKIIVAASNNKNKIHEIKSILNGTGYKVISLEEAGIEIEPEENGKSFAENALIKARASAENSDYMVISDDSGLVVDCLGGLPGIKSKRYAGENACDDENNEFLVENLKKSSCDNYPARFKCAIALIDERKQEYIFEGKCEGEMVLEPHGNNGFGYDPYFYVEKFKKTMAQMTDDEKNSISHRGVALRKLKLHLDNLRKQLQI